MDGVLTIGEVTRYLKMVMESDVLLANLWVSGEVSNLSHSPQGHTYFTLKDASGQLRCVLFRQSGARQAALLRQGIGALVHGRISIYEAQGTCQLYVDLVQPEGVGLVHRRLEELKARLLAEGLFDAERKRPLPPYPRRIGLVTSSQAAALQDILRVIGTRFPAVEVILAHSAVQGDGAPSQLAAAIVALGTQDIDVIVVARGGGSIEELWAFNDEAVARAIAASPIPVVSGVGHETDTTVADLAADVRAPTPTAAAVAIVPDRRELLDRVRALDAELRGAIVEHLDEARRATATAHRALSYSSPRDEIRRRQAHVSTLRGEATRAATALLGLQRARVGGLAAELHVLGPLSHFERGYAVVSDAASGELVTSSAAATVGRRLRVRVRDGTFESVVVASPPLQAHP